MSKDANPFYHARIFYPDKNVDIALNLSRSELYHRIVAPFFSGQVTAVPLADGIQILNLRAARRISLHQTETELKLAEFYDPHEEKVKDCTAEILEGVQKQLKLSSLSQSYLALIFAPQDLDAFVIMKYGDKLLDSAYTGVIRPTFNNFGLKTYRIDEREDSGKITDQMLESIAKSSIIYADLTGERPNCYYELGFAHALGKNVILTIHKKHKRHFDIGRISIY